MLYELPYRSLQEGHDKTASNEPDPVVYALVTGDLEKLAAVMTQEDLAVMQLSNETFDKLASGEVITKADVESMSPEDIAALTLLGDDAHEKVAATAEFYAAVADHDTTARHLARQCYAAAKLAEEQQAMEAAEAEAASEKQAASTSIALPADKEERSKLVKAAMEELKRRGHKTS